MNHQDPNPNQPIQPTLFGEQPSESTPTPSEPSQAVPHSGTLPESMRELPVNESEHPLMETILPTPENPRALVGNEALEPTKSNRKKIAGIVGAGLALVGIGIGTGVAMGDHGSAEKKPVPTSAPSTSGSPNTSPSNSPSTTETSPSNPVVPQPPGTPSTSENSPTSLPSFNPEKIIVPNVAAVRELPFGVPSQEFTYNGWKMQLPTKLVDPELNPELFVQEVLMIDAVAETVPIDSPIFDECIRLYGTTNSGTDMRNGTVALNKNFQALLAPYTHNPSQEVYYHVPGVKLTTKLDKVAHTVSVTSTDGKSGIWFAADATANAPWQNEAAMDPALDQHVFPHGENATEVIHYTYNQAGDTVVTLIDTGTGVVNQ